MTAQTQPEVAALLDPWPGPNGGLPPLAGVSPAATEEAMRASIDMKRAEVQAIASRTAPPTFENTADSFRAQICAGLNAGLSGIGWWTTDIGGFYDGNGNDPCFRELLVRWFQWAVFCPVTRLHGYRVNNDVAQREVDPAKPYGEDQELDPNITGGDNEVWSWGEEVYDILRHCLSTRERLRPYVMRLMAEFSVTGAPPLRPLFFDFPDEIAVWSVDDQHMFGPDLLVAPVLEFGARSRSVLLPSGSRWTDVWTGNSFEGGQRVEVGAPLERMPVFARDEASVLSLIE
jgi:alpha-D-xyloside xylohydrolase